MVFGRDEGAGGPSVVEALSIGGRGVGGREGGWGGALTVGASAIGGDDREGCIDDFGLC